MPKSITPSRTPSAPGLLIINPKAADGAVLEVDHYTGIQFDFDATTATFKRADTNLVLTTSQGEKVTFVNFFAPGEGKTLPQLHLQDGTVLAGKDFLAAHDPNMDLVTAAGPQAATVTSSGINAYADNVGDLIGGVDRLGLLGTYHWDIVREVVEITTAAEPFTPSTLTAPLTPVTPDPKPIIPTLHWGRIVVSGTPGKTTETFSVDIIGSPSKGVYKAISNRSDVVDIKLPGDSVLDYTLTHDGKLQFSLHSGYDLSVPRVEQVGITLADNSIYTLEVVLSNDPTFTGTELPADIYGYGIGEWIIGNHADGKTYTITGLAAGANSSGQDAIVIEDRFQNGSTIWADGRGRVAPSGGADSITLKKGMTAEDSAENAIHAVAGKITLEDTMTAQEGTNTISGGDSLVFVDTHSETTNSFGLFATGTQERAGTNKIYGAGVIIASEALDHNSFSSGVHGFSGKNIISSTADVKIISEATKGEAYGLFTDRVEYKMGQEATPIGQNLLEAEGNITVEAIGHTGARGVHACLGKNSVASEGEIKITANSATGSAWGVIAENLHWVTANQENEIKAGGNITIETTGVDQVYGVVASRSESNNSITVTGEKHSLSVNAYNPGDNTSASIALSATSGKNILDNPNGQITLKAENTGAHFVDWSPSTSITMYIPRAIAMEVSRGYNEVNGWEVNLNVDIAAAGGVSYGMDARSGTNVINASTVTLNLNHGSEGHEDFENVPGGPYGFLCGMSALFEESENFITANETVTFNMNASCNFIAMESIFSASNTIAASDVAFNMHGGGDAATSMSASFEASNTIMANGAVTFTMRGDNKFVTAVTSSINASNTITANEVTFDMHAGSEYSQAMSASSGGANAITANEVTFNMHGDSKSSIAMNSTGGTNAIEAKGESLTLTISFNENAEQQVAMQANFFGAINSIKGGTGDDDICIAGDILSGAWNGQNIIETGEGNDRIELHGAISTRGLEILAGEGEDTLVLKAADAAQFERYYKDWLTWLLKDSGLDHSIEKIEVAVETGSSDVLSWLGDLVDQVNAANLSHTIELGVSSISKFSMASLNLDSIFEDSVVIDLAKYAVAEEEHSASAGVSQTATTQNTQHSMGFVELNTTTIAIDAQAEAEYLLLAKLGNL